MKDRVYPDLAEFSGFLAEYDYIPVCREIVADLDTPSTLYHKLAEKEEFSFLLESLEGGER